MFSPLQYCISVEKELDRMVDVVKKYYLDRMLKELFGLYFCEGIIR